VAGGPRPGGDTPPGTISIGRVGRAHGLDGAVRITRPRAGALALGGVVVVDGVEREVLRLAGTADAPIVHLDGIDGRDAAEALRGRDLLVPRTELPPLDEDEFWPDDLVGLRAVALDGTPVGVVAEVVPLPSCDALRVERPGEPELLVPLVRDAVPRLDLDAGTLHVDLAFMGEGDAAAADASGA